jgi:leucyl-tRNA synthetase
MKEGILLEPSEFAGRRAGEVRSEIIEYVEKKALAKRRTTYRLRDWLLSRQRYWGAPIPIVYDPEGKPHAIPEDKLPWMLPTDVEYLPKGTSPLGSSKELLNRTEKLFGKGWKPEIDTMDTFVCSSWYFLRFADPHNTKAFASAESLREWLPVDLYIGGAEHTVLHLMYARFFTKALRDMGYLSFDEPFMKLRHQGLILAEDGRKMSKRWDNVINPDDMVERFGADALRVYEMFMGPFEQQIAWSTDGVVGARRFIERVWAMQGRVSDVPMGEETTLLLQQTIEKVSRDIEAFKFNTAVSTLMIFSNHLSALPEIPKPAYVALLQLLNPFAPHVAAELASLGGYEDALQHWPKSDPAKLTRSAKISIQINGKVRAVMEIAADAAEEGALAEARRDPAVAKWLSQGKEKRAVYVPGRVINFIVDTI